MASNKRSFKIDLNTEYINPEINKTNPFGEYKGIIRPLPKVIENFQTDVGKHLNSKDKKKRKK